MSLSDWQGFGWLVEHKTDPVQIKGLLAVADIDLADAQVPGLSLDGRFKLAYGAALQFAAAALAAKGFRAVREAYHYRVIQSLAFTIEANPDLVAQLNSFRRKRHRGDYECPGLISESDAREMTQLAQDLRQDVTDWLRANYPELVGARE